LYTLLLLNGGIGSRMKTAEPKQFIKLNGIPMLIYSVIKAQECDKISEIIINYPEGWLDKTKQLIADYGIKKTISYVLAGSNRHESVTNMLKHSKNNKVLIHEAARPVIDKDTFNNLIEDEHDNVSYMIEIPFTVAPVDPKTNKVTGYLDRNILRNVQLPQKFNKNDLEDSHQKSIKEDMTFTEDATLCAYYGKEVFYLTGKDSNIKVTTQTDKSIVAHLLQGEKGEEL